MMYKLLSMCKPAYFLFPFIIVTIAFGGRTIRVPADFSTIHGALGEAGENDTVLVSPGVYKENIALVENVVLKGVDRNTTIINGRQKGPCVEGANNAVIENFTITNGTTGIICRSNRPTIRNNLIVDNKGAGIHVYMSLPDIKNNVIYRNEWTGIFLEDARGTRTTIKHNVILENGYCGIFCANGTEVVIKNNILMKNKQFGVYVSPEATKTRIIFNNFYGNRQGYNNDAVVNQTNKSEKPNFNAPQHPIYDYFLKPSSGLKNTGENGVDIGLVVEQVIKELDTDQDNDGILDEIDQCPSDAEDKDGFADEDGCPEFDNDEDGIQDANDKCPLIPEDLDGFEDQDGCPEDDNDKDGIVDANDACPNRAEVVNGFKDDDGCPDDKPMEISQKFVLKGVNFKTASAELLDESYYVLENVFNSLEAYPEVRVEISGHTDNVGNDGYNLILSENRAKAVKEYLVMRGIPSARLVARGYGEDRPIASNSTADGRALNRRVELEPLKN